MQHQVLDIRAGAAGTTAKLYTYIRDESPEMEAHRRPAVVICPGGGYGMTSDREAEPVALKFLEKGFQCFVLRYSVERCGSLRRFFSWRRRWPWCAAAPTNGM